MSRWIPSRSFLRALLVGAGVGVVALFLLMFLLRDRETEAPEQLPAEFNPADFVRRSGNLDVPYVVTDYDVVDAMLAMADVKPNDFVVDLGSGDGRILIAAARTNGARGLGVDIDPARIRESTANAQAANVSHRVTFRRQDLFNTPIGEADVLTLYLLPEINLRLRPRILEQMRPGTRVVSHDFDMGEWRFDQRQRVGSATIYMWIVPARVEGRWTLTTGGRNAEIEFSQSFQSVGGTVAAEGRTARIEQGRLTGPNIRFLADAGNGRRLFEGRVEGDRIVGTNAREPWQAVRAPAPQ